jgi:hypothetical protein
LRQFQKNKGPLKIKERAKFFWKSRVTCPDLGLFNHTIFRQI